MRILERIENIRNRLETAIENGNEALATRLTDRLERVEARAEKRGIELNDIDWTPPVLIPSDDDAAAEGIELNDIDWTPPVLIPSDDEVTSNPIDLGLGSLADAEENQFEFAISGDNVIKLPLEQTVFETSALVVDDLVGGLNLGSLGDLTQEETCEIFASGHNVGSLCEEEITPVAEEFFF